MAENIWASVTASMRRAHLAIIALYMFCYLAARGWQGIIRCVADDRCSHVANYFVAAGVYQANALEALLTKAKCSQATGRWCVKLNLLAENLL
jgi:hypothetical protein